MKRRLVIRLLYAAVLAGCATVTEVRQSPPIRVGTVAGNYLALANCVMADIGTLQGTDGMVYQLWNLPATRSASIVGVVKAPAGLFYSVPSPVLDLTFKESDEGRVAIESRAQFPGSPLEPRVWPIVERCAGTKVTLAPPLD